MRKRKKKKKTKKLGRGVNCEEEMREKNEMGGRMYVCGGGEKKKKRKAGMYVMYYLIGRMHSLKYQPNTIPFSIIIFYK